MTGVVARSLVIAAGAILLGAGVVASRPRAVTTRQPDTARFLADAREGTRRYQSQREAINDGFRRVGGEFPAMGEHWVSFARVMEDTLDARRPSVLIYVNTATGPRLAGVAYSRLLAPGRMPPSFPFPGAWHQHNGAVAEESLPTGHGAHGGHAMQQPASANDEGAGDAPRFHILHAWVWTANPDGPFATDNWALPLSRDGIEAGAAVSRDAVRALALADDAEQYHRTVISRSLRLDDPSDSTVALLVAHRRAIAMRDAAPVHARHTLSPDTDRHLAATWDSLWIDLAHALPARSGELAVLRSHM